MYRRTLVWGVIVLAAVSLTTRDAFAQNCYRSSIMSPTPFLGNHGEIVRLADGSIWEIRYEYEYMYEYFPQVAVCPGRGLLIVGDKALNVERVAMPGARSDARPRDEPAPFRVPEVGAPADDEFTFYDSRARATAYIEASSGLVIYLWSGEPVAYLDRESIFGFNGTHLGWYHDGLIYDHDGQIVVAPGSAFQRNPGPPPPRSLKSLKPLKGLKELKPLKPLFGMTWSTLPARVFFLRGLE